MACEMCLQAVLLGGLRGSSRTKWAETTPGDHKQEIRAVEDKTASYSSTGTTICPNIEWGILLSTLTSVAVTYLMTLSDWTMSCQPGIHVVVTVSERDWKHRWAAYRAFDETGKFNVL